MPVPEASGSAESSPTDTIAILMATYNGERHLRQQLDSILGQSVGGWTLHIHDDGSTDSTSRLLASYAARDARIIVHDYSPQHGACANFLSLLQRVNARYYLFADQDDVWHPDKVRTEMAAMRHAETLHPGKPILVHSDLTVVDEQLSPIAPSFFRYSGLHPEYLCSFDKAVLPFVTGCTVLLNAAARQAMQPVPDKITMHDAWATLCTLHAGGEVVLVDKPLVKYRQHFGNTLGARDISKVNVGYRLQHLRRIINEHHAHYQMLRHLGYGSVLKYLRERVRYKLKASN